MCLVIVVHSMVKCKYHFSPKFKFGPDFSHLYFSKEEEKVTLHVMRKASVVIIHLFL